MLISLAAVLGLLLLPDTASLRVARSRASFDEQRFYAAVHSELVAGASLRQAIGRAASSQPCRELSAVRAAARAPIGESASALRSLPGAGPAAAVAVRVAAQSGGATASVFLRLADRAAAAADVARQQRALTTQARLSAAIVGGLPIAWLVFGGVGRIQTTVAAGGLWVVVVGAGMQLLGGLLVLRLASS